jgi:hypothetical protein
MSMPESIQELIQWIQNFNYPVLSNIDDRNVELHNLLFKNDFQPAITREDNCLIVVQPKVAIACNFPQALGRGDCQIRFSNILFNGLKIRVNHHNILGEFMIGLKTRPEWKCRPFLQQLDKNSFAATLGQTTITLSNAETTDLCSCIDQICQEYKKSIIELENILETWNFDFIESAGVRGFYLLTVEQELWELMYRFANEFNYATGKTAWHLFCQEDISIRISRGIRDHALIVPKIDSCWTLASQHKVKIIYQINHLHLQSLERGKVTSWQQNIGLHGTWTAKYTQQWLIEKYIPQVINYYSQQSQICGDELLSEINKYKLEHPAIHEINDIKNLLPYLQDIQSWLNNCLENMTSVLLRPYYQAFTDLLRNTDSSITGIDYLMGNLCAIKWSNRDDEINPNSRYRENLTFKNIITCLDAQVARINNSEYEHSYNADLITRTFIWIIQQGKISFSQAQMNAAKQALLPLWEQSRFEMRHVYLRR